MIEWFGKFWVWVQNRLFELFNLVIVLAILYLFIRIVLLIVRWYGKARIVRAREDYRTTVNFIQANPTKSNLSKFERFMLSKTGEIYTKTDIVIIIAVLVAINIIIAIVNYFIIIPISVWLFSLLHLSIITINRIQLCVWVLYVIFILSGMYFTIKNIIKTARFFDILYFIFMICILIGLLYLLYAFININKL
ncbi:hypothetical protein [Streptococcus mitis]|jgi:hypothetical protein|uniref:hypothetical protein n=1 Tax=Streptococcus mitis TaxID=28037 RepID=UPI002903E20E|nr:hypothetical protein [Streptococcus mitis]MDU7036500.1 hypothetical protein [Staphylococcus simulans]